MIYNVDQQHFMDLNYFANYSAAYNFFQYVKMHAQSNHMFCHIPNMSVKVAVYL